MNLYKLTVEKLSHILKNEYRSGSDPRRQTQSTLFKHLTKSLSECENSLANLFTLIHVFKNRGDECQNRRLNLESSGEQKTSNRQEILSLLFEEQYWLDLFTRHEQRLSTHHFCLEVYRQSIRVENLDPFMAAGFDTTSPGTLAQFLINHFSEKLPLILSLNKKLPQKRRLLILQNRWRWKTSQFYSRYQLKCLETL